MTELLTGAQMRALERAAIEAGNVSGRKLMERAGQGVVDAILEEWPEFATDTHAACVLCGPGNNGGDGFVIARLLRNMGWTVRVHFAGDTPKRSSDARIMHGKWTAIGEVLPLSAEAVFGGPRPNLIVDAVFGIGLTRPLPDDLAAVLDVKGMKVWKSAHSIKRVAVDCPSGLDLDRGMLPSAFDPDDPNHQPWPKTLNTTHLTVTFHTPKLGHYLGIGPVLCKKLQVVDIGLGGDAAERRMIGTLPDSERVRLVDPVFVGRPLKPRMWPASYLSKFRDMGHKYDHGHVYVFSGGVGRGGAARLAARGALRCGAGLVTVVCPPAALIENACQLNAIMLRSLAKDAALDTIADNRVSAFCIGPGMGVGAQTRQRVLEVLDQRADDMVWRDPAVVLDADALTSFADDPETLFAHTHARTILTPHEGEFGRLFPDLSQSARDTVSKVDAARAAAARAGCIVLLKGVDTVIAEPRGGAAVHATVYGREVPWLATAGSGDVLAGTIAGLAASGSSADLFMMAEVATYLHVEAARTFGPGLIAEDVAEQYPTVFKEWGL